MSADIWIGFANIAPHQNAGYDFDGAYVNIICLAKNYDEFIAKAQHAIEQEKMRLIEMTEIELFAERTEKYELEDEIMDLADSARTSGTVCFSTFHAYDAQNEN